MKLSLLLLASLTTGCFAAQDFPELEQVAPQQFAQCWTFIKQISANRFGGAIGAFQLRDRLLKTRLHNVTDEGYQDCILAHEQIERVRRNPRLKADDKKILKAVSRSIKISKRVSSAEKKEATAPRISLDDAIAEDDKQEVLKAFQAAVAEIQVNRAIDEHESKTGETAYASAIFGAYVEHQMNQNKPGQTA